MGKKLNALAENAGYDPHTLSPVQLVNLHALRVAESDHLDRDDMILAHALGFEELTVVHLRAMVRVH